MVTAGSARSNRLLVGWCQLLLLAFCLHAGLLFANIEVTWPESFYNPQPQPGDLILPLPCNGALVLRRVPTPPRSARYPVMGGFTGADGTPYLLIGKYELSALQAAAIRAEAEGRPCPEPQTNLSRPMMSDWVGALTLTEQYSRWLVGHTAEIPDCESHAPLCLPREDGVPAYVRLPTAEEWEFAARGGLAVSPDAFGAPRYPMTEGLAAHAWYAGNAADVLHPIGKLAPNALGLHDLYGNVAEWSQEMMATPGGKGTANVALGGDIESPEAALVASERWLHPLYADDSSGRTGVRLTASVPIYTTLAKVRAAARWRATAGAVAGPSPRAISPAPEPVKLYGKLRVMSDVAAEVLVDGIPVGQVSPDHPFEDEAIKAGERHIALRTEGYTTPDRTEQLQVGHWTEARIEIGDKLAARRDEQAWREAQATDSEASWMAYLARCETDGCEHADEARRRLQGALNINSAPPGMQVTINGETKGTTPIGRLMLPGGDYHIELTDPDGRYAPYQTDVHLDPFGNLDLQPQMEKGVALVDLVGDRKGSVSVNGSPLPDIEAPATIKVPAGKVLVEIRSGNAAFRKTLHVRHGDKVALPYELKNSFVLSLSISDAEEWTLAVFLRLAASLPFFLLTTIPIPILFLLLLLSKIVRDAVISAVISTAFLNFFVFGIYWLFSDSPPGSGFVITVLAVDIAILALGLIVGFASALQGSQR